MTSLLSTRNPAIGYAPTCQRHRGLRVVTYPPACEIWYRRRKAQYTLIGDWRGTSTDEAREEYARLVKQARRGVRELSLMWHRTEQELSGKLLSVGSSEKVTTDGMGISGHVAKEGIYLTYIPYTRENRKNVFRRLTSPVMTVTMQYRSPAYFQQTISRIAKEP